MSQKKLTEVSREAVQLDSSHGISVTTEARFRIMNLTSLGNQVWDRHGVEVGLA